MTSPAKSYKKPWLKVGENAFYSRLLIGFEQYRSPQIIADVLKASKVEIIIIGIITSQQKSKDNYSVDIISLGKIIDLSKYTIIGTTSSAGNADEAVKQGLLLCKFLDNRIVKLDVRTCLDDHAYPDNLQTLKASKELIRNGCIVLPMISPDIDVAQQLQDIGCAALRILVGKIGSNAGIENQNILKTITGMIEIPVIAEGGISRPSDISIAFEAGADAVLINTAIAKAPDPVRMAQAMRICVEAAYLYSNVCPK